MATERGADAPRLLDLFCCEGGAAMGYSRAGFDVYGVDLFKHRNAKGKRVGYSQRRYPFPSHQGDALAFVREHGHKFDVIHASPPCQHATAGTRALDRSEYPALIEPTRNALEATGLPYVIENVEGADLIDPLTLCGTMFGLTARDEDGTPLELWRHRCFESNVPLTTANPCLHGAYSAQVAGVYGGARSDRDEARNVRHGGYVPTAARRLGIPWVTLEPPEENAERWVRDHGHVDWHGRTKGDCADLADYERHWKVTRV